MDVFVAAALEDEARAHGLAEALTLLGFDAAAGTPQENDIAAIAETARAVVVLWSRAGAAPWLSALAVLAQERGKLVNAELDGAAPTPVQSAPRASLWARERAGFRAGFEALIAALDGLAHTPAQAEALPQALAQARAALLARPQRGGGRRLPWRTLALAAVVIVVGFGAGRLLRQIHWGQMLVATPTAVAAAPAVQPSAAAEAWPDGRALERGDWRAAAQRLGEASAIQQRAARGEARAQTMACLGHMSGAAGFLPSPTMARGYCDAAAAQNDAAGLYLSWVLQRTAPHAGLSAADAQARLAAAARLGFTAAQIDYAESLAGDARAPLDAQAEAGRLFLAAAEAGDARGQYFYARWLRDSRAGPRDPAAAAPYLERAARGGQLDATHMLATLYRDGIGVRRDESRAKALYEQAARANHAPSMFNLADMLRTGSAQDRARAVALYKALACMRDELQIRPLAAQRLHGLRESVDCR